MNTSLRVVVIVTVAAALALVACSKNRSNDAAPPQDVAHARYSGPLPAVPVPSFEPPRPREVVEAVYNFAGRRPDVLRYVPCFCGCQNSGHVGNDDCFVSSRDATGKPTWDLHGMG